jgi:tripartite-type tricarboxylate transporter receptor subunit TctC
MMKKLLVALPLAFALATPTLAQGFPDRPIRIVHGFGAGGNADAVSRIMAEAMTTDLGQPIIVEPRPGAGGTLASGYVANEAADGYTLQLMVGGHSVAAALYNQLPFDSVEDFTFLSTIGQFPFFVATRDGRFASIQEAIDAARAAPGTIVIGHSGVGSTQHLTGELLGLQTNADFIHAPYQGGAAAATALMGGEVDLIIDAGTVIRGQADAGVFTVLAVTSGERWPDAPDVPTLAETVAPGFDVVSWTALGAPAALPADVTARLSGAISAALAQPSVQASIVSLGAAPIGSTGDELRDLVARQITVWNEVITAAGVERR